ncbi:hypothetical protein BaRGS_00007808, partial [Batillaria attramentaria]
QGGEIGASSRCGGNRAGRHVHIDLGRGGADYTHRFRSQALPSFLRRKSNNGSEPALRFAEVLKECEVV